MKDFLHKSSLLDWSNLEKSYLILIVLIFVLGMTQRSIRKSGRGIIRSLTDFKVLTVVFLYIIYVSLLVYGAWRLDLWKLTSLHDTVLAIFLTGLPMVFNVTSMKDGKFLVRDTFKLSIGLSALFGFYLNLEPLNFFWSLLAVVMLIFSNLMAEVLRQQGDSGLLARKLLNGFSITIVLFIFGLTTIDLIKGLSGQRRTELIQSLAVSVWLPLMMLPFLYLLGFFAQLSVLFRVLPMFNERRKHSLTVRMAIFFGFRLSLRLVSSFVGVWRLRIGSAQSYKVARVVMSDFRRDLNSGKWSPDDDMFESPEDV